MRQRWFSILFSLLGIVGLTFYITGYSSELRRLDKLSVDSIAVLSLLVVLGHLLSTMKFRLSARIYGVDLPFWEAFMMVEAGSLINSFPLSGAGFRALYLKKVHGLRYVDFGMGMLALLATGMPSGGMMGLVGLLTLSDEGMVGASYLLVALFLVYTLGPCVVLGIAWWLRRRAWNSSKPLGKDAGLNWWGNIRCSMLEGLDLMLTQPQAMIRLFLLNLLTSLVVSTRFWLIGTWLGYSINFASGLVLWNANQVTTIFIVVPSGAIGLREALTGLGAAGLGGPAISGVMISAIDRVIAVAVFVSLGSISVFLLRNKIAQAERANLKHGSTELPE